MQGFIKSKKDGAFTMKSGSVTYMKSVGVTYGAHRGLGRIHFPDQQTVIT